MFISLPSRAGGGATHIHKGSAVHLVCEYPLHLISCRDIVQLFTVSEYSNTIITITIVLLVINYIYLWWKKISDCRKQNIFK